jgi:hypothetical protein
MKTKVSIDNVILDLKTEFQISEQPTELNASFLSGRKFNIDKRKFERGDVIEKLQNYFSDKVIDGGYLKVGNITFVFTDFEVCEGHP